MDFREERWVHMKKLNMIYRKFSGLFILAVYAIVISGIASVFSAVRRAEYSNVLEKFFTLGFLVVLLLFALIHVYGDISESAERKRSLQVRLTAPRGGYIEKFFEDYGMDCECEKEDFVKRAVDQRISDIESGKIRE